MWAPIQIDSRPSLIQIDSSPIQVVDVLEGGGGLGLCEPHASVAAVYRLLRTGLQLDQAAGERVVVDKCAGECLLDGPGRAGGGIHATGIGGNGEPVGGCLEHVQRLDECHLREVPVEPGEVERAGWRGFGRDHPARRKSVDGLGRRCHVDHGMELGPALAPCFVAQRW